MPDVERLLGGYSAAGRWGLGQVCRHLAPIIDGSIDGFPKQAPWLVRMVARPVVLPRLLRTERMPEGIRVPARYLPPAGLDDRAEAEALRASLGRSLAHDGPVAPHPFFGPLTRAQWDHVHRIHCAHHLSFLTPSA